MDCIFCKIISKEVPSNRVFEDGTFVAFKDIRPSAPVHVLVVPRKHIASVNELESADKEMVGAMVLRAKIIAKDTGVSGGYKLQFNVGKDGGQIVEHLHLHLMGGWNEK